VASHRGGRVSGRGHQRNKSDKGHAKKKSRVPIDELFAYWVDLLRRPTLTQDDFRTFLSKTEQTLNHFMDFYGHVENARDKFFRRVYYTLIWLRDKLLEKELESPQLTDHSYATMKDYARKFIPRITNHFGQQLALAQAQKTPLQDAADLNSFSTKLTYRWAAGIVASNHIAELLIRLSNFKKDEKFNDDIKTLYTNLKNRTRNPKLKRFLTRSYRRFEDADKTRNRCAHVNEGDPTRQEVEQSISLAQLLQRFVSTKPKKKTPPERGKVIARTSGVTGGLRERR
jgi:hypothetical protein